MKKPGIADAAVKMLETLIAGSMFPKLCSGMEDQGIFTELFDKPALRALIPAEIELLEKHGNTSFDWKRVHVTDDFTPKNIWNTRFHRLVIIGSLNGSVVIDGTEFSSGISNSFISNAIVGDGAFIHNVGLCSRVVIGKGAVIFNCGSVTHESPGSLCIGTEITAGNEAGGRMFPLVPELNFDQAALTAEAFSDRTCALKLRGMILAFAEKTIFSRSMIADNARLCNTTRARNFFIGNHALVEGALEISDSIMLSEKDEPVHVGAGSIIRNSILQYGCHVDSMAIVDHSFLSEHSGAARHGKVTESFLGPNTHVAEGEVTSCFVGPFVGFHHQALLISAWWPEGRGNIAYGANVGSNHTGKLADQEIFPGEGTFFGLGSSVKFPANFREAPYSIIASGVTMLPQKISFPFSLVNTPSEFDPDIPPAFNEIFPGWVLSDNIYSVLRNVHKYGKRNKARRASFDFSVWRPDVVMRMHDAKNRLQTPSQKRFYTVREIPGLGKNYLTEENRVAGIRAYSFYCDYFCRQTLLELWRKNPDMSFAHLAKPRSAKVRTPDDRKPAEAHGPAAPVSNLDVIGIVFSETDELSDISMLARNLKHQKLEIKKALLISKARDDRRGPKIIDDYTEVHTQAIDDPFIAEYGASLDNEIALLESLI